LNFLVGTEDKGLVLRPLIANRMHDSISQGCVISISDIDGSDGRSADVIISDRSHDAEKERTMLCTLLADIIVENLQIRHLVGLLKEDYYFLSEKEQCDILVRVLKKLWYGDMDKKNEIASCKSDIKNRLGDVIRENEANDIILEGFMRFRMKDYLDRWQKELASAVEDYIKKKEYAEFVEILRLFIKIRIPRARKVHLCVGGDGDYLLLDEKLCLLKCRFIGSNIDRDDALLSALVNIAPQSIIVHNRERFWDPKILETIKDVFGQRVEFSEDMI
jgi:putative sporulation protein YtxC